MENPTIQAFTEGVRHIVPRFKVVRKADSSLMKFLAKILFFLPDFMENFGTTVGDTVYLTDHRWGRDSMGTAVHLGHEAQHVYDKQRFFLGMLGYGLFYLAPQIFALASLGALLAIWFDVRWLWCLTSIALIAPLPAYGRYWAERRGYLISLLGYTWLFGDNYVKEHVLPNVLDQFTSSNYYFMWPFRGSVERWLTTNLHKYKDAPEKLGPIPLFLKNFLKEHGKVVS